MQLQPKDLGNRWHIALVRHRALGTSRIQTQPRVGRLGRFWARGLDLAPEVVAATLPMMADHTNPVVYGIGAGILLVALVIALAGGGTAFLLALPLILLALSVAWLFWPRTLFRRMHLQPVEYEELEALKGAEKKPVPAWEQNQEEVERRRPLQALTRFFQSMRGARPNRRSEELERVFLSLVQDVLALRDLPVSTEAELKGVLRALGEAIAELPATDTRGAEDTADLLGDAQMLAARAEREPDMVVAQSLLRQADSLVAQARATENNRKLARRVGTLREEMLAQVKMLRSLLPSLKSEAAAATDLLRFSSVASSVQSIATEASSVAEAREELNRELWTPQTTASEATVRVGTK